MTRLRQLWSSPARAVAFAVLGAAAGLVYWYTVGCRSGTCALTGSPWRSALFMGLVAGLAGWPEKRAERKP